MPNDPIPNPNLRDFWLQRKVNGNRVRFRILYGGRDSSKSWDAAARVAWLAHQGKLRVLCTRMFQNRIEDSVYETIKTQVHRFGWEDHFKFQRTRIYTDTGSEFLFYGLARNVEEIKSMEGIDLTWMEEGQELTQDMFDEIEPTIRKEGSEIWAIFNPQYETDFIWQRFIVNTPGNALVRKINYTENPFLTDTSKSTIERRKKEDYDSYEHIYLGVPKEDDEGVIIKRKWIEAAIDAHKKLNVDPSGSRTIGFDPADGNEEGTSDENAYCKRYGQLIENVDQWIAGEDELMKSSKRTYNAAAPNKYEIVYDSIGVGASCGSKFKEINKERNMSLEYRSFNAGGKVVNPDQEYKEGVLNKDHFSNVKAQVWLNVADLFRDTYNAVVKGHEVNEGEIISISSSCEHKEQLISELSAPKRDYDTAGRFKVESKKDMESRGIDSPNLADALMMTYAPEQKNTKRAGKLF